MTKPPHSLSKLAKEFREAVTDVTPLPACNAALLPKSLPRPTVRSRSNEELREDDLSDHLPHTFDSEAPLSFQRPGLQHQAWRQLKRGGAIIEDELDLHGLTVAQARSLLVAFLDDARVSGLRFVRIIHGKGLRSAERGGVLRSLVASWLMQRDDVMAFHEARPADGGSGAVLVSLRRAE